MVLCARLVSQLRHPPIALVLCRPPEPQCGLRRADKRRGERGRRRLPSGPVYLAALRSAAALVSAVAAVTTAIGAVNTAIAASSAIATVAAIAALAATATVTSWLGMRAR